MEGFRLFELFVRIKYLQDIFLAFCVVGYAHFVRFWAHYRLRQERIKKKSKKSKIKWWNKCNNKTTPSSNNENSNNNNFYRISANSIKVHKVDSKIFANSSAESHDWNCRKTDCSSRLTKLSRDEETNKIIANRGLQKPTYFSKKSNLNYLINIFVWYSRTAIWNCHVNRLASVFFSVVSHLPNFKVTRDWFVARYIRNNVFWHSSKYMGIESTCRSTINTRTHKAFEQIMIIVVISWRSNWMHMGLNLGRFFIFRARTKPIHRSN